MAPTCTCTHAKTDHLTGRCVHRQTGFDPAIGAVVTACPCKTFDATKKKGAAPAGGFPATVADAAPATESAGTAPAKLTTQNAPSTQTTATGRKK